MLIQFELQLISSFKNMTETLLLEAKKELTIQIINILSSGLYKNFLITFAQCKSKDFPLRTFQEKLSEIHLWNQDLVNKEFHRIMTLNGPDQSELFSQLLEALFITNAKILNIVRLSKSKNNISLSVPNSTYFVHKCFIECARKFYMSPSLFSENVSPKEIQKNNAHINIIIRDCIENTCRNLMPMKNILDDILKPESESESENEAESEPEAESENEAEGGQSESENEAEATPLIETPDYSFLDSHPSGLEPSGPSEPSGLEPSEPIKVVFGEKEGNTSSSYPDTLPPLPDSPPRSPSLPSTLPDFKEENSKMESKPSFFFESESESESENGE